MSSSTRPSSSVGDELDAADVHALEAVEPQHGSHQLAAELGRDEHDPHVGRDRRLLLLAGVDERRQLSARIQTGVRLGVGDVLFVGDDDIAEVHRRNHRGVAERLEVHVRAVVALQLYDYEAAGLVHGQQVDPTPGLLPLTKLLRDHKQVVIKDADVIADEPLQILALP